MIKFAGGGVPSEKFAKQGVWNIYKNWTAETKIEEPEALRNMV